MKKFHICNVTLEIWHPLSPSQRVLWLPFPRLSSLPQAEGAGSLSPCPTLHPVQHFHLQASYWPWDPTLSHIHFQLSLFTLEKTPNIFQCFIMKFQVYTKIEIIIQWRHIFLIPRFYSEHFLILTSSYYLSSLYFCSHYLIYLLFVWSLRQGLLVSG